MFATNRCKVDKQVFGGICYVLCICPIRFRSGVAPCLHGVVLKNMIDTAFLNSSLSMTVIEIMFILLIITPLFPTPRT